MTIAPNSDVTIDEFVYNPDTGKGELAMSAVSGVLRFVGGKLSKNENAVTMKTPTGTLSIRGGVFMMNLEANGHLDVVFLYGKSLTVTGINGLARTITRAGFGVTIAGPGAPPSPPGPRPPGELGRFLAALTGHAGSTAGTTNPPSDATVANSGIGSTISGNFTANVQAANQTEPPSGQPQPINFASTQTSQQVNTVQSQQQQQQIITGPSGVVVYPFGIWLDAHNNGNISVAPGLSNSLPPCRMASSLSPLRAHPSRTTAPAFHCRQVWRISGLRGHRQPGQPDRRTELSRTRSKPILRLWQQSRRRHRFTGGKTSFVFGGIPTVNLPTIGIGTYSGPAFGEVYNNGASYVATGNFNASYNFGNLSGNMTISNLDGNTFGGPISGIPSSNQYIGSLTGSGPHRNIVGAANGYFFGPGASTTGGFFAAASTSNPYQIFGVFGGVHH